MPASGLMPAGSTSSTSSTRSLMGRSGELGVPGGSSNGRFPCSKLKLDNLFLHWLSQTENQKLVLSLLEDAKNGAPLLGPTANGGSPLSPASGQQSLSLFSSTTPPLSPQKPRSPKSPMSPTRRGPAAVLKRKPVAAEAIPQFYFPNGRPVPPQVAAAAQAKLDLMYVAHPEGLNIPLLKEFCQQVLELPSALAYPLYYKLVAAGEGPVPRAALEGWLQQRNLLASDRVQRMHDVLRKDGCEYATQEDLKSMLAGILLSHPGLEFLQETPEFQDRYAETVIYRIFYSLDKSGTGKLTLRDLRRGDLLEALMQLDDEADINKVLKYFSYEHFYVIYCKFWELDQDHDFLLSKEDLLRYGNHALTYRIVERIFSQAARPFVSKTEGRMGYEDFVAFILSEEDKTTDLALEYWFRCCDLDCDGMLRANEMLFFYEEQLHRMECVNQEAVLFEDVLCQMHDMIQPAQEGCFTLRDLKRTRSHGANLFNTLFNLTKFIAFETRDPFVMRQEREDPGLSDWDRFARMEYLRLSIEEEAEENDSDSNADVWDSSLEAPF